MDKMSLSIASSRDFLLGSCEITISFNKYNPEIMRRFLTKTYEASPTTSLHIEACLLRLILHFTIPIYWIPGNKNKWISFAIFMESYVMHHALP